MENRSMFDSLFAEHQAELLRFAVGILRDPSLATDLVQTVFVKGAEAQPQGEPTTLKGWLFRVAFNEAMQVKRKQAIERRAFEKLNSIEGNANHSPAYDPLVRQESIDKVKSGLETLPVEQREIVRKRIHEDKTFAEIARELSLPLGTVLTRMRLAMEKLRKILSEDERK